MWAFSGPVTAQKFGPEPDEYMPEAIEPATFNDIDLEFSEDERLRLKELRAWLHQRNLDRARAAAFSSGDVDEAGRFDSDTVYRPMRPPQLLHDARNWQGRRQPGLPIGQLPDDRIRNRYVFRDPKTAAPLRQQLTPDPVSGRQADVRRPAPPVANKAKSRVRLVWTTDTSRHKFGPHQPLPDHRQ
ncbi:hypothetical protein [Methylocaldum sp.]|uniref:hypothetical protein n=1 Tax=Methylocaldum sp. TaxID=1969727 RepID=UPI002D643485|nr:hypothetical protein [Methylocaldum sp.]HYE37341.1 hypothetical protein [Methylocaldum sp.]